VTQSLGNEMDKLLGQMKSATSLLREVVRDLHGRLAPRLDGHIADYIPELATANPQHFGITLCTVDGQIVEAGDCLQPFTIQSVSKPFVFGMALEEHGVDHVLSKVGVEPTGEAFNSIVLDEASNRPFNPMVNAGAIATADLIPGKDYPERVKNLLQTFSNYCGRPVHVDNAVFMSERLTGHRNRAMAHLMRNFGMVSDRFEDSLELYFQQCSIAVTAHDLAVMGATLARGGVNPLTNVKAISAANVKYLLSAMLTCGMYDFAGEWAFRVGLPAKSGVAGGIVVVIPGVAGIGLYSPLLDSKGNSIRGVEACLELSKRFGLHAFEQGFEGPTLRSQLQSSRGRHSQS
jgi:glutaminase